MKNDEDFDKLKLAIYFVGKFSFNCKKGDQMPEWVLVIIFTVWMDGSFVNQAEFHYHDTLAECKLHKALMKNALAFDQNLKYIDCDLRYEWGI